MNTELQETAVTRPDGESPRAGNAAAVRVGPHLHKLSTEHAALLLELTDRDVDVLLCLGRGMGTNEIARKLQVKSSTAAARVESLRLKTGMTRLSLAAMGYLLLGQVETLNVAA